MWQKHYQFVTCDVSNFNADPAALLCYAIYKKVKNIIRQPVLFYCRKKQSTTMLQLNFRFNEVELMGILFHPTKSLRSILLRQSVIVNLWAASEAAQNHFILTALFAI